VVAAQVDGIPPVEIVCGVPHVVPAEVEEMKPTFNWVVPDG